jgi:flagellum-specific ATP synthase
MASSGRVSEVAGLVIESVGPAALIGEVCEIQISQGQPIRAEVVGFRDNRVLLMPIGALDGISMGNRVVATGSSLCIKVGPGLLGRVIGGVGEPIDGLGPLQGITETRSVYNTPPHPLRRGRVKEPLGSGIRAIDGFLTLGKGQRVGIFSGSGVGKSILMGEIAKHCEAAVTVVCLVGERGREVREFIENCLGPEGMKRSVVVAVTSDQPALVRLKGPPVATTIAEYFRDQGKDVMLMMDSVTRFCNAQRELGLSIGEPPTTRGYPPSAFAMLPKLLERSGNSEKGSITGLYTVLVDGDDLQEPVSDACRGILDGHIVLDRRLADRNHFPAIDILASVSRTMPEVVVKDHNRTARDLRSLYATYRQSEDLISIGAYTKGADPRIDRAIDMLQPILQYLQQSMGEFGTFKEHTERLLQIGGAKPASAPQPGAAPQANVRPQGQALSAPRPAVPAMPQPQPQPRQGAVKVPPRPAPPAQGQAPAAPRPPAAPAPGPVPRPVNPPPATRP